jgi:hypothetical protein
MAINPWIISIIVLLIVLGVFIYLYIKERKDCNVNTNTCAPLSSSSNTVIFNAAERNKIKQSIMSSLASDMLNDAFDNTLPQEQNINKITTDFYFGITYHLLSKYGPSLNNFIVPASKQLPVPSYIDADPAIPAKINNYVWWLTNSFNPGSEDPLLSEQAQEASQNNLDECTTHVIEGDIKYLSRDANGKVYVKSEYNDLVTDSFRSCLVQSESINETIDVLLDQLNDDLQI